jgi:hypothetical protein
VKDGGLSLSPSVASASVIAPGTEAVRFTAAEEDADAVCIFEGADVFAAVGFVGLGLDAD